MCSFSLNICATFKMSANTSELNAIRMFIHTYVGSYVRTVTCKLMVIIAIESKTNIILIEDHFSLYLTMCLINFK